MELRLWQWIVYPWNSDPGEFMEKLAWFRFFPGDFLNSRKIKSMRPEDVGYYVKLLCLEWEGGPLPTDFSEMGVLLGLTPRAMRKVWEGVGKCFVETDEGFVNERLERTRAEQVEFLEQRRFAGRQGAKKRWQKHSTPNSTPNSDANGTANGDAIGLPLADKARQKLTTPSSQSSTQNPARAVATAAGPIVLPDVPAVTGLGRPELDEKRVIFKRQLGVEPVAEMAAAATGPPATGPPGNDG